jgi:hypothetical protein
MKSSPPRLRWLLLVLACALASAPALASTFRLLSLRELVGASSVVAIAEVRSLSASARIGRIETTAVLEVSQAYRGTAAGALLEVRVPGGEVGDRGQRVEGAPELRVGETRLVFLFHDASGALRFTGLSQGALLVEHDRATSAWVVRRSIDARVVAPGPRGLEDVPYLRSELLDGLLLELRRVLAGAP